MVKNGGESVGVGGVWWKGEDAERFSVDFSRGSSVSIE